MIQKWEYLFVSQGAKTVERLGTTGVLAGERRRVCKINGTEFGADDLEIWQMAKEKGEEGWELVSAVQGHHWELVFKRPRQ